jgi:hypothetical protein
VEPTGPFSRVGSWPGLQILDKVERGTMTFRHYDIHHSDTQHDSKYSMLSVKIKSIRPSVIILIVATLVGKACQGRTREYQRGKYHCTIDLLFYWFRIVCLANKNSQLSHS